MAEVEALIAPNRGQVGCLTCQWCPAWGGVQIFTSHTGSGLLEIISHILEEIVLADLGVGFKLTKIYKLVK